jgi:hypothetical protein
MARVCEPLDDGAETLRHAGGRIADAVVVNEKKPHDHRIDRSQTGQHNGIITPF